MKTIILSFDDARKDFYVQALPILKKYKLTATLNVISDFVIHPDRYHCFNSANNKSMAIEELLTCQKQNIEIACHGHYHQNNKEDVLRNINCLKKMGLTFPLGIGFASPNSEITQKNIVDFGIRELLAKKTLTYVRSGIQIRREGIVYTILSLFDRILHHPKIWYWLNQRNIILKKDLSDILPSVTIHSYTTLKQIQYFIEHMPEHSTTILMFHSVCSKNDVGYGKDKWYWDCTNFDKLCSWLHKSEDIQVCNTLYYINNH